MTLWAIVPVKPLLRSKSRLARVLSREERVALSQKMLVHTLEVLQDVSQVERILVVSRDSRALSLARKQGARTVMEYGSPTLNRALSRATLLARGYNVSSVLILPADLPLLDAKDVEAMIRLAGEPPVVVIAPDRRGTGTNALLSSPPGVIEFAFGPRSYMEHLERAKAAQARVEVCDLASIAFDVDLPEDLDVLRVRLAEAAQTH